MTDRTIDIQALRRLLESGDDLIIVDVRDEDKFRAGTLRIEGFETLHLPYLQMKDQEGEIAEQLPDDYKKARMITVCTTGNKAGKAAELLREKGFQACSLEGGLTAWKDSRPST